MRKMEKKKKKTTVEDILELDIDTEDDHRYGFYEYRILGYVESMFHPITNISEEKRFAAFIRRVVDDIILQKENNKNE